MADRNDSQGENDQTVERNKIVEQVKNMLLRDEHFRHLPPFAQDYLLNQLGVLAMGFKGTPMQLEAYLQGTANQIIGTVLAMQEKNEDAEKIKARLREKLEQQGGGLSAADTKQIAAWESGVSLLALQTAARSEEIRVLTDNIHNKLKQDIPGLRDDFSIENTSEEEVCELFTALFDGMEEEERKRKAKEYKDNFAEVHDLYQAQAQDDGKITQTLVKIFQRKHLFRSSAAPEMLEEFDEAIAHDPKNQEMRQDRDRLKESYGKEQHCIKMVHQAEGCIRGIEKAERIIEEKRQVEEQKLQVEEKKLETADAVEVAIKVEGKIAADIEMENTMLELCHGTLSKYGITGKNTQEFYRNGLQAQKEGRIPANDEDAKELLGELKNLARERTQKESAQQEEKQPKPLDGKPLPEQDKETAKDKDFDAQIKHLGAVFQPHSGQTGNRGNWQQRIDPPTPPDKGGGPDKGGNGRGR